MKNKSIEAPSKKRKVTFEDEEDPRGGKKKKQRTDDVEKRTTKRKRHLEEGFEPFSMEEEMENGAFDAQSGQYVPNKEKREKDPWLFEVDNIYRNLNYVDNIKKKSNEQDPYEHVSNVDILIPLTDILHKNENVFQAMRRLKPKLNANRRVNKRSEKKEKKDTEMKKSTTIKTKKEETKEEKNFNRVIELADVLVYRGFSSTSTYPE
eukprot:TRINITY_DN3716_c0_g1_i3.p1 TRINITY_DN3716_c0_g1~~TRINITY_DN3716_c0_g1_i3.p1  ORF type:complete len:207 (+),score=48.03 TRINITY_DN3716_c0_g1_i3:106-726(+)